MWIWSLDSAMGATTAHRAPEKVVDGTCTQVWAWMTNKCRRRMNGGEGYITIEISRKERTRKTKREGGRKTVAVLRTPKNSRREAPKNREEEELILGQSSRINFYPIPTCSIIPSPYSHVRLLYLSLRPSSWACFLYQVYCIGPVGFGLIRLTVKNLPKVDPT